MALETNSRSPSFYEPNQLPIILPLGILREVNQPPPFQDYKVQSEHLLADSVCTQPQDGALVPQAILLLMVNLAFIKYPKGECENLNERDLTWGSKGLYPYGHSTWKAYVFPSPARTSVPFSIFPPDPLLLQEQSCGLALGSGQRFDT